MAETDTTVDRTRFVWLLVLGLALLALPLQYAVADLPQHAVLDRDAPWWALAALFAGCEVFLVELRWGREAQRCRSEMKSVASPLSTAQRAR